MVLSDNLSQYNYEMLKVVTDIKTVSVASLLLTTFRVVKAMDI